MTHRSAGATLRLDKRNSLDLYLLADWCNDKAIDTDKAGTVLRSLTWERQFVVSAGIGYKISF